MTREEVINTLRNARSSNEMRQGDTLEWYYRYFNHMDDEQRRKIFDKEVAFKIGKAIEAELEEFQDRVGRGENHIKMFNGATWFVKRESQRRKFWHEIVASAMRGARVTVETCRNILREIGILGVIDNPPQTDKRDQYENRQAESAQPADTIPF